MLALNSDQCNQSGPLLLLKLRRTVMAVEERKKERREKREKKSMIIVVPSCLKDADGARTRWDQKYDF